MYLGFMSRMGILIGKMIDFSMIDCILLEESFPIMNQSFFCSARLILSTLKVHHTISIVSVIQ